MKLNSHIHARAILNELLYPTTTQVPIFEAPKLWSDTRMAPYGFDQLLRFLECSIYNSDKSQLEF